VTTLLHMTTTADWAGGRILPAAGEDFIHLSRPDQVHIPANLLYAGRRDLLALAIDPARLRSEVRVEGGFPHLYGDLTADAVFDVAPFLPDDDGAFHLVVAPAHPDHEPAATLLAEDEAELTELYGGCGQLPRAEVWLPDGRFLVAWLDGAPIACAGIRPWSEPGVAELKRMYVRPAGRSQGIARRLLGAAEAGAARAGYHALVLDTGAKQPHAEALYRSAGYTEVEKFNDLPAVFYGRKPLT
jgi:uncharacterized protein (DUF952 family)